MENEKEKQFVTSEELSLILEYLLKYIDNKEGKLKEVNDKLNSIKIPDVSSMKVRDMLEKLDGDERLTKDSITGLEDLVDKKMLSEEIKTLQNRTQLLVQIATQRANTSSSGGISQSTLNTALALKTNLGLVATAGAILGDSTIAAYTTFASVASFLLTAQDTAAGNTVATLADPGDTILQQQTVWSADANRATYDWIYVQIGLNDLDYTESAATALARYQTLINTINADKKSGAIVIVGTMLPPKARLIAIYGATNGATAYTKWQDMNTAIMGSGANAITGVDYRVDGHTEAMNDGNGNLSPVYGIGAADGIHENDAGRKVIAGYIRRVLTRAGFWANQLPLEYNQDFWGANSAGTIVGLKRDANLTIGAKSDNLRMEGSNARLNVQTNSSGYGLFMGTSDWVQNTSGSVCNISFASGTGNSTATQISALYTGGGAWGVLQLQYAGTASCGVNIGTTSTNNAKLMIGAGTATAGTAPLQFTTGTVLTTPVSGTVEYNNTFHVTNSDATRRHIATAPNTTKVTAGAPYTNDGYVVINIGGTDFKVMTTA